MKLVLITMLDLMAVIMSFLLSNYLRFDFNYQLFVEQYQYRLLHIVLIVLVFISIYFKMGMHRSVWSRVSLDEAIRIVLANFFGVVILFILWETGILLGVPRTVIFNMFFINVLIQFAYRAVYRAYRLITLKENRKKNGVRVLIYGAGDAGKLVLNEILQNRKYNYNVIGFIDDDVSLKKGTIYGIPIFGDKSMFGDVITQYSIDEVIIAMPSIPMKKQNEFLTKLLRHDVEVKIIRSSESLVGSGQLRNSLKKLNISDLLERPEIKINDNEIAQSIVSKRVLITGAGGSIGSELVRQIISYKPEKLILVDSNETGLYGIQQELVMKMRDEYIDKVDFECIISNIRDRDALDDIFSKHQPQLVYHAAAHKHVPLMEGNPEQAIKNNIFGTQNLIEISIKHNIEKFVNISTDKAVNPTNVMGATKRFNEMMLQAYNEMSDIKFVAVRFGNVLGSNGSVVPIFQKQIENGGPVTVTHPDIIRYFMTIPEAVNLVLQASTYAKGGEIFVLDMGDPVKILTLAEKVILLSGYEPYEDIDIVFTGLRPGEKLFEELLMAEEGLQKTPNDLIFIANPIHYEIENIQQSITYLKNAIDLGDNLYQSLQTVVPTYTPEKQSA